MAQRGNSLFLINRVYWIGVPASLKTFLEKAMNYLPGPDNTTDLFTTELLLNSFKFWSLSENQMKTTPTITEMSIAKVLSFTPFFCFTQFESNQRRFCQRTCQGVPSCLQPWLCPQSVYVFITSSYCQRIPVLFIQLEKNQASRVLKKHWTVNCSKILKKKNPSITSLKCVYVHLLISSLQLQQGLHSWDATNKTSINFKGI